MMDVSILYIGTSTVFLCLNVCGDILMHIFSYDDFVHPSTRQLRYINNIAKSYINYIVFDQMNEKSQKSLISHNPDETSWFFSWNS